MKSKFIFYNRLLALYLLIRYRLALAKARHYDKKIGIKTGRDFHPKEDNSFYKDGVWYSPAFYGRLQRMVEYLNLREKDVFVDMGCGKGRVVFFVALQKIKKVIGVEINKYLIDIAKDNLKKLKLNNSPINFVHVDAANFDVREGTVFL